jgi:hypothetical protein
VLQTLEMPETAGVDERLDRAVDVPYSLLLHASHSRRFATMTAFAVKHIAGDLGPISKVMKQVKKAPYSYASNEPEATNAALGNDIYVFEVRAESKGSYSYWLGYKFKAFEKYPPAGGGKWLEKFKFKNAAKPCEQAEGSYFDAPIEILDPRLSAWLGEKRPGMAEIPPELVLTLDSLLCDPANNAQAFA